MTFALWSSYFATVLIFMSTPGPSHLLMLSNSLGNGFKKSTATAAGDLSANLLQMIAASVGLASILYSSQAAFLVLKWAGVAYLLYLGLKLILSSHSGFDNGHQQSTSALYWQGFITSASNPKAVVFFAALFPQFIQGDAALLPQFVILSATYLIIDGMFLCAYGKFAEAIRANFQVSLSQNINRLSGCFLIVAAVLLGIKQIEQVGDV